MNPSYCRIRTPVDDALQRFAAWQQLPQVGPFVTTNPFEAVALACDEQGQWRGHAVLVSDLGGWTLFQDLTGGLGAIAAAQWLKFAAADELIFAGYNDSIPYGELVAIRGGVILREFLWDRSAPEANVNRGCLDCVDEPFQTWVEVASFVEDDDLGFSETGRLWIYRPMP